MYLRKSGVTRANAIGYRAVGLTMLCSGLLLNPISQAIAAEFSADAVAQSESEYWSTYKLDIKNTGSDSADMREAVVEFLLPVAINDIGWASNHLSYPSWEIAHTTQPDGVLNAVTLKFPEDSWVDSELASGESASLTIAFGGELTDLNGFEDSVVVKVDGEVSPPPEFALDIVAPVQNSVVYTGENVDIITSIEGDSASKLEFWINNTKLAEQPVVLGTTEYQQTWQPSEVGAVSILVMAFNENGDKLTEQSVQVSVESESTAPNPPVIEFISPESGSTHQKGDTITISANVTDVDDDLATVKFFASNAEVCSLDANTTQDFSCDWTAQTAGSATLQAEAQDEEQHISRKSLTITVTDTGSSCGDIPEYKDGVSYKVGDEVTNIGNIYSCVIAGWCGNPVWTPGTGHPDYPGAWKDAWDEVGQCDPNPVPLVNVQSPQDGQKIEPNQAFDVIVEATDDTEVTRVEVQLNGQTVATSSTPSQGDTYTITVPAQDEGQYTLTVVAYDDQGASAEAAPISLAITDKDLVVSLSSPVDGSSYFEGRAISIKADAKSYEGDIGSVSFIANGNVLFKDTEAPYEYEWLGAQKGTYAITAKAVNTANQEQTSATSNVTVKESTGGGGLANNPDRSISYLTSWGLNDYEELFNSQGDGYLLSFGKWDASGNITISDEMLTPPDYNSDWMPAQYLSWSTLKHDNENAAMMVAFGGQTYESIWSAISTPESREAVATGLEELLHTPFPVYKKNLKPEEVVGECLASKPDGSCDYSKYQLAGYVQIDGLDFDFEKAARITDKENQDLTALIKLIREKVGNTKVLSLTTYHVGADPVECMNANVFENCSYIEESGRSSHHGEVIDLLKATKNDFDFFNVMTYDAGRNFLYDVAMENYAEYIGDKSKIVLGNTINSQWAPGGNFVETRQNNLDRAKWQKDNGYGGFFMWTLGSNNQGLSMAEQVDYFNEMISVSK
ncbi:Ig-like domain-containing protein [Vibrio diabolicus]|uniref:Ig-like domain-containing protein n=1 Tax=Vibrio diabolicus TaxID=50719 RepID=UPI002160D9D1|nr:Ig-like domain-containing protein [Vibrio diabolicus]MCS0309044.1 Ig-like domain-containing protein [Vibrio diabolicus]